MIRMDTISQSTFADQFLTTLSEKTLQSWKIDIANGCMHFFTKSSPNFNLISNNSKFNSYCHSGSGNRNIPHPLYYEVSDLGIAFPILSIMRSAILESQGLRSLQHEPSPE
jgi:hypothetical protein